jgi:hypothetical protein
LLAEVKVVRVTTHSGSRSQGRLAITCLMIVLLLAAGCGAATPTAAPLPVAQAADIATAEPSSALPPTATTTWIPVTQDAAYKRADLPIEERVADLLATMTLAEKIGQMTLVEKNSINAPDITGRAIGGLLSGGGGYPQPNTPEAWADMVDGFQEYALKSRLGIPLIYGLDAVHGHNNVYGAVIFPHNIGLGAAGDPEMMERIGQVTAAEMIGTGIYWNYAPVVAVPRDMRWGRTYEGYSGTPSWSRPWPPPTSAVCRAQTCPLPAAPWPRPSTLWATAGRSGAARRRAATRSTRV